MRWDRLEALLKDLGKTALRIGGEFLTAPLTSTDYTRDFGTVYTASYWPHAGSVVLNCMDGSREEWRVDAVDPRQRTVEFTRTGSRSVSVVPRVASSRAEQQPGMSTYPDVPPVG